MSEAIERTHRTTVADALDELVGHLDPRECDAVDFLGKQFDLGLAWVHFDVGNGGLGVPRALQRLVDERLLECGAPLAFDRNPLGIGMVGPAIHDHGDQRQRHERLRPLFQAADVWCQLFSEPGAGSDLASLATQAVLDGDTWVINGQKVWTSFAHQARRGLLIARTRFDVKHAGLTAFMLDMDSPGVEVRPLFQMTGDAEFNEVFLHDVRVPDLDRLDAVGEGWSVVRTTLMNERVTIGDKQSELVGGTLRRMLDVWAQAPDRSAQRRDELIRLWVDAEVLRLLSVRTAELASPAGTGVEGSMSKILAAKLNQRLTSFALNLSGADALLKLDGYARVRSVADQPNASVIHQFLRSQANSIEGGTSDIARDVLAERMLGLPRDR